jgi:hypothetical protein
MVVLSVWYLNGVDGSEVGAGMGKSSLSTVLELDSNEELKRRAR